MSSIIKLLRNHISLIKFHNRQQTTNSKENSFFDNENNDSILKTTFTNDSIEFRTNDDRHFKKYPYIWLRDHCKCSKCFNTRTEELEFDMSEICIDIKPKSVKHLNKHVFEIICEYLFSKSLVDANKTFIFFLLGTDGHTSEYNLNYLKNQAFEMELKKRNIPSPFHWNKDIFLNQMKGLQTIDFYQYLNEKTWIRKTFEAIIKHGAVLIENVNI